MFGHQNNDQPANPQPQSIDGVVAPASPYPAAVATDFNPALPSPGTDFGTAAIPDAATTPQASSVAPLAHSADSELLEIKQRALNQLSPLVSQLEQSPEEKFRTTMMMIQASDNPDLIKEAYAAAEAIPEEKAKAQALLDIVNEINYFTQRQP